MRDRMRSWLAGLIPLGLVFLIGCTADPSFRFYIDRSAWLQDTTNQLSAPMQVSMIVDGREKLFEWPDASSRTPYRVIGRESARVSARVAVPVEVAGGSIERDVREGSVLCLVGQDRYLMCTRGDGADPAPCDCENLGVATDAGTDAGVDGQTPVACTGADSLSACESTLCITQDFLTQVDGRSSLALDADYLYFLPNNSTLSRWSLQEEEAALELAEVSFLDSIAVDDEHVYWSEFSGRIRRVSKSGGDAEVALEVPGHPTDIEVDDEHVYLVRTDGGTVSMGTKTGTVAATLSGQADPYAIELDDQYVYWLNHGSDGAMDGQLVRAEKGDLTSATVLIEGLENPHVLAVGQSAIAWATHSRLWVSDKDGGDRRMLMSTLRKPQDLYVHGRTVYAAGEMGLWKVGVDGGEPEELESRAVLSMTGSCEGVFGHLWYDDLIIRYGK